MAIKRMTTAHLKNFFFFLGPEVVVDVHFNDHCVCKVLDENAGMH